MAHFFSYYFLKATIIANNAEKIKIITKSAENIVDGYGKINMYASKKY